MLDLVAQPGGLLELQRLGRPSCISSRISSSSDVLLAFEEHPQPVDVAGGSPPSMIRRLHGAVHWLMRASRQGRNQRQRVVALVDVERAGAELEDLLQHLDRPAQAAGAGERAVELGAAVAAARG